MESSSQQDIKFLTYLTGNSLWTLLEIENNYTNFNKHEKIRIEHWCKKLCEPTNNTVWKKSRNLYAMLLLDQVLCGKLNKPFINLPPDGGLPTINENEAVFLLVIEEIEILAQFQFYLPPDR